MEEDDYDLYDRDDEHEEAEDIRSLSEIEMCDRLDAANHFFSGPSEWKNDPESRAERRLGL